jgi:hypothetical protein
MRILLFIIISFVYQTSYTQEACFAGSRDGVVTLINFKKGKKLYVKGKIGWKITSWTCYFGYGSRIGIVAGTGEYITDELHQFFIEKGDSCSVAFSQIIAQDAEGNSHNLDGLELKIIDVKR